MRFYYSTNLTLLFNGGKGVSYVKEKNSAVLFTDGLEICCFLKTHMVTWQQRNFMAVFFVPGL